MSIMEINSHELIAKLNRVAQAMTNTAPLTAAIAGSLAAVTDDNFAAQGRPTWAGRKPSTIKSYQRRGLSYGGVLQLSGNLRARIVTRSDQSSASIGSNMPYAAIQYFGGMAGRNRKVKIEGRPYLPMDANGFLQREAEIEIGKDVDHYLNKSF